MKKTLEDLILSCQLPPLAVAPAIHALDDPAEFQVRVIKGVYRGGVYKVVDVYEATCYSETRFLIELGDDEGDIVLSSRCIVLDPDKPEPLKTIRPKKKKSKAAFDDDEEDYAA